MTSPATDVEPGEPLSLRELFGAALGGDPDEAPLDRGPVPGAFVVAVVVVHDGATWLRSAINALVGQTRGPDLVVAVDTGSTDACPELLATAVAAGAVDLVVTAARETPFGAAVARGLADAGPAPQEAGPAWVWLLHDDCAPAPDALEELLRAAELVPGAAVLGPKVVDWNDPRVLVEVGLTVDRAGRRHTGLEARELDQGQADAPRTVLAVGTAGALVRRAAWDEAGGTDPALPIFRDDVDLCWRLANRGLRTEVAPRAVVRHARAAATGQRHVDCTAGPPRRADRRHALWVQVAHSGPWWPLLLPLLLVTSLLRAAGDLVTRRPHHARDEVAAMAHLVRSLPTLMAARRVRSQERTERRSVVRSLLAPRGSALRLRLSQAGELLSAGGEEGLVAPQLETGPTGDGETDGEIGADDGRRLGRLLLRPAVLLPAGLLLVSLVATRALLGTGVLVGGRLLPTAPGARDLWASWSATWDAGVAGGSATAAPPWTPWLALLSTLTVGRPGLAVALLLVGTVPAAGLVAWHATRSTRAGREVRLWVAATWALAPVATGAVSGGRFDVCVAVVLLPWLLRLTVRLLLADGDRWRTSWSLGLLLAIGAAFEPPLWTAALLVGLVLTATGRLRRPGALGSLGVVLGVPVALALPWLPALAHQPVALLAGLGTPTGLATLPPAAVATGPQLLLVSPAAPGVGAAVLCLPLLLAAITALVVAGGRRRAAAAAALLAAVGVAASIVTSRLALDLPDGTRAHPWPALGVALATLGLLTAAAVAGRGLRGSLTAQRFGLRTVAVPAVAVLAALVTPVLAVVWMVDPGGAGAVQRRPLGLLPPDVQADARAAGDPSQRVLVLARRRDGSVRYEVGRLAGPQLGDEDREIPGSSRRLLDAVVRDLAAVRGSDAGGVLSTFDVRTVIVPGRARTPLTDALDTQPALSRRDTPYDLSLWQVTLPSSRLQILPAALAAAAQRPAASSAGIGRGPSRAQLVASPPVPVASGRESARSRIAAGEPGRLLVLADARDGSWRASLDGRALSPTQAWGWAQAWRLPPGGGRLELTRSAGTHHALQVLSILALLVVVVLALPGAGRDEEVLAEPIEAPADGLPAAGGPA